MAAADSSRRTVLMLPCQALAMTGASIVGTTGAIVGSMPTPHKALSTLPIAVQMTGMMAFGTVAAGTVLWWRRQPAAQPRYAGS